MLSVRVFGPGGHDRNTAPEYFGLMGVAHGPLRKRYSGKGRVVPERLPVDPSSFFASLCSAHSKTVVAGARFVHSRHANITGDQPLTFLIVLQRRKIAAHGAKVDMVDNVPPASSRRV